MAIANKIRRIGWEGKRIPEGFAIDKEGHSITDADMYFTEEGAILPLGSTPTYGVHKGFGLLLISDILTGVLSGDGGSMLRKKGAESHIFCALRIDAFPSGTMFQELMDEMIGKIHTAPTVEGAGRMRYPGERMDMVFKERSAKGIPLNQITIEELRKISVEQNLPLDDIWYNL
jgi:LDH2 family malate/lactate/ureidoglycolate dehydrogenase